MAGLPIEYIIPEFLAVLQTGLSGNWRDAGWSSYRWDYFISKLLNSTVKQRQQAEETKCFTITGMWKHMPAGTIQL